MTTFTEENLPFPLVRPAGRAARPERRALVTEGGSSSTAAEDGWSDASGPVPSPPRSGSERSSITGLYPRDRLTPGLAGGLFGAIAAAASLGLVHAIAPRLVEGPVLHASSLRGVDVALTFGIAYGTVVAMGGLVGTTFAIVTRYLRKWFPLLVWSLVFFVSLAMLLLVATSSERDVSSALAGPVLLASAVFAVLVSFSLPIRRRR